LRGRFDYKLSGFRIVTVFSNMGVVDDSPEQRDMATSWAPCLNSFMATLPGPPADRCKAPLV